MSASIRSLVEAWVSDAAFPMPMKLSTARGTEEAQDATTVADFLGTNTSDPNAEGKAIFEDPKNLPTAISTIMGHTQKKANFHPAAQSPKEVAATYPQYLIGMDNTPFFHLIKNDYVKKSFHSKDYNKLIDEVADLYEGVSQKDVQKIKDGIVRMGKSVFGSSTAEQWNNLFSQSVINYDEKADAPLIYVYYTTLHMKHEEGKSEVNEQDFVVNRADFKVLPDLIHSYADSLAKLIKTDVDDWITDSSSPTKKDVRLCFETA